MSEGLQAILDAFARLVKEHDAGEATDDDEGSAATNFRCVDCVRCTNCRFCTQCEDCENCNYCDACHGCSGCTQCRACEACAECSHSTHSAHCERCSYVTLCYDCEGCVHCFACVGLEGEEFCVLNEKLSRREYFAKVARLKAELDVLATEGWCPPWQEEAESSPAIPAIYSEVARTPQPAVGRTGSWPSPPPEARMPPPSAPQVATSSGEDAHGTTDPGRTATWVDAAAQRFVNPPRDAATPSQARVSGRDAENRHPSVDAIDDGRRIGAPALGTRVDLLDDRFVEGNARGVSRGSGLVEDDRRDRVREGRFAGEDEVGSSKEGGSSRGGRRVPAEDLASSRAGRFGSADSPGGAPGRTGRSSGLDARMDRARPVHDEPRSDAALDAARRQRRVDAGAERADRFAPPKGDRRGRFATLASLQPFVADPVDDPPRASTRGLVDERPDAATRPRAAPGLTRAARPTRPGKPTEPSRPSLRSAKRPTR